jgi:hypothetical protein
MYFRYGNYTHQNGEVTISITQEVQRDKDGNAEKLIKRLIGRGTILGDTPAEITTKLIALETAYNLDYQDAVLYLSDGTTSTVHTLINATTLNGVKSSRIRYPNFDPTQYVNRRDYEFELYAEFVTFDFPSAPNSEFNFQETVTQIGTGGPRYVIREPRNGPPIRQIVSQQTPVVIQQVGSASARIVGSPIYPFPNPPLYPDHLRNPEKSVTTSLDGRSRAQTNWSYTFDVPSAVQNSFPTPR